MRIRFCLGYDLLGRLDVDRDRFFAHDMLILLSAYLNLQDRMWILHERLTRPRSSACITSGAWVAVAVETRTASAPLFSMHSTGSAKNLT